MTPTKIIRFDQDGPITDNARFMFQNAAVIRLLAKNLGPIEEVEFVVSTCRDTKHEIFMVLTDLQVLALDVPATAYFTGGLNSGKVQRVYLLDITDMAVDESAGQVTIRDKKSGNVGFTVSMDIAHHLRPYLDRIREMACL